MKIESCLGPLFDQSFLFLQTQVRLHPSFIPHTCRENVYKTNRFRPYYAEHSQNQNQNQNLPFLLTFNN